MQRPACAGGVKADSCGGQRVKAAAEADRGSDEGKFMQRPACGGGVEANSHGSQHGVEAMRGIGVEAVRAERDWSGGFELLFLQFNYISNQ